ncbi:MAG: 23S rRNA (adenine(2503)-C(2))-methyltransferase RlmN, partial [Mariprofundaceae bacterium]
MLNNSSDNPEQQTLEDKPQLPALLLPELQSLVSSWGEPAFRAKQIIDWRNKGMINPDNMRNISESLRQKMQQNLLCNPLKLVQRQCSSDGTRKYLFALERESHQGKMVETVLIPDTARGTVCISSQVGCVLDCPFC